MYSILSYQYNIETSFPNVSIGRRRDGNFNISECVSQQISCCGTIECMVSTYYVLIKYKIIYTNVYRYNNNIIIYIKQAIYVKSSRRRYLPIHGSDKRLSFSPCV